MIRVELLNLFVRQIKEENNNNNYEFINQTQMTQIINETQQIDRETNNAD